MAQKEKFKIDKVYRLWDSTLDIIDYAKWLPEVVGQAGELLRIGSVPVDHSQDSPQEVIQEPLRFVDADVTAYRKRLTLFRKRHKKPAKNKSR